MKNKEREVNMSNKTIVIGCYIFGCAASLIGGIVAGKNIRDNHAKNQIAYMQYLANNIKERNNQMVNNIAQMYEMSDADKSKFSKTDELLMEMWMD